MHHVWLVLSGVLCVTWWVLYRKQELLILHKHQARVCSRFFLASVLFIFIIFLVVSVFLSTSCVLCIQCCQYLWIVYSWLSLRFSLTFIFVLDHTSWMFYNARSLKQTICGCDVPLGHIIQTPSQTVFIAHTP